MLKEQEHVRGLYVSSRHLSLVTLIVVCSVT
jgi:hypothetical protein